MHDIFLAKEILDRLRTISQDKKINHFKRVGLEIGQVALAHEGHPEHLEDISIDNLEFLLKSLAKGEMFDQTIFEIKKSEGNNWKIIEIDGE